MPDKKMINVRLSPELWKHAKSAAGQRGQTLERWVTDALDAHIRVTREGTTAGPAVSGGAATHAVAGSDVTELTWRVSALEEAVDFLASQLGGGFSGGAPASARGVDTAQGDDRST